MSAQHTPGPFEVESYGEVFEVMTNDLAVTVARCTGARAAANAERIKACLNAFDGAPYGYHWFVENICTGDVVESGFRAEDPPAAGPTSEGFRMRVVPVYAGIARAEGGASAQQPTHPAPAEKAAP